MVDYEWVVGGPGAGDAQGGRREGGRVTGVPGAGGVDEGCDFFDACKKEVLAEVWEKRDCWRGGDRCCAFWNVPSSDSLAVSV